MKRRIITYFAMIKMALIILWLLPGMSYSQKVAIVQYEVKEADKIGVDITRLEGYVRDAAPQGAGLVVLPETPLYRYKPWKQNGVTMLDLANHYLGLKDHFSCLARELKISLVMGLREPSGDKEKPVYNTALFIGPEGTILGKQRKLVPSSKEQAWTRSGALALAFDTPVGRVGLMICKTAKSDLWDRFSKSDSLDFFILIAGDNDGTSFNRFPEICKKTRAYGILANLIHGPEETGRKGNSGWAYPDGKTEFLGAGEHIFYKDFSLEQMNPKGPMYGQIIPDPMAPDKLVYKKDENKDGKPDPFFLCGPGDPEGFLYRGNRNPDGTRDGDQLQLIDKLHKNGGNCIYMIAVRTHGGDAWKSKQNEPEVYPDDLHNPWIGQDPANGLNEKILDQWEEWFRDMDQKGIVIYFFIYDDAIDAGKRFGWKLDSNGDIHPGEKEFIHALVNRFKHHKNLIWCVMEEGQEIGEDWQLHISKIAEAIAEADEYDHIIASHQLGGNIFFHKNDIHINQFAIQTDKDRVVALNDFYLWLREASENAKGQYSLVMSEDRAQGEAVARGDREEVRQRNWLAAMAGTYPLVLGMDIAHTPVLWLDDLRILQRFFESSTFNQMSPVDSLSIDETTYVLADEGYDYILYSKKCNNELGLKDLPAGSYRLQWLDCSTGYTKNLQIENLETGQIRVKKPEKLSTECALFIYRVDSRPETHPVDLIGYSPERDDGHQKNTIPEVEDYFLNTASNQPVDIQLRYHDADGGPGPYTITIIDPPKHGTLTGFGNDKVYRPEKGFIGKDQFKWKVNDGEADSPVAMVTVAVGVAVDR